jgi:hypothetical protein
VIAISACTARRAASAESSRCKAAKRRRSVTVETTLVPAGPYARAINGSTGTGPPAMTVCPAARRLPRGSVAKVVSRIPASAARPSRIASAQAVPVAVSITRPSKHQPAFVYDQKLDVGTVAAISAASRESAPSSSSLRPAKPNSSPARSGSPERFARRSRRVALSAQRPPRSFGAKNPYRRPRHRMPRGVLTQQSRQIAFVHATTLTRQAHSLSRSAHRGCWPALHDVDDRVARVEVEAGGGEECRAGISGEE